jgi:hypothetical protein
LVVQNGPFAGTCRLLSASLNLIGRSPGCEIRLNGDDVNPLHCAILQTPGGLVLRDLESASGSFVNGQRVTTCLLADGDTLTVGSFEFRVRWQAAGGSVPLPESASRQAEAEARRVQVAAVAAQQAALFEEEARLQQRRAALEKQEEQLAAHLEERRRTLVAAQEEVRREQAQLHRERAQFEQERRTRLEEAARDREQVARELHQAKRERQRLTELRRRLHKRWKRQWAGQETALRHREQVVARDGERFRAEQVALVHARLRFNGEVELGKRQLQDGWRELGRAQREWQALSRAEEAELARQRQEASESLAGASAAQRALAVQDARGRAARALLDKEMHALENRIRNLRIKLAEHEKELARKQGRPEPVFAPMAVLVPPPPATTPAEGATTTGLEDEQAQALIRLETLAGDLADQRLRLAEQWERFLRTQQDWQAESTGFLPRLEEATRRIEQREQNLIEQEQQLAAAINSLHEQQEDLTRRREQLEAWQAQQTAAESAWRSERVTLLVQVETAEALAARRQEQLDGLHNRWALRRKEEFARLSQELKRCRQTQRHYAELCRECERRSGELGQQERSLAERKLALEQFQLELAGRSENAAATEKKIAKLRRQLAALHTEAERRLAERRRGLEIEADRLRAQVHHLNQRAEAAVERESALSARQTEWEHQQAIAQREQERQQQELFRLRRQGDITGQQRDKLQDELDRLIRLLLEEAQPLPLSVVLAA